MDVHISNQPENNFLSMFTGDGKHTLVSRDVKTITLQKNEPKWSNISWEIITVLN